MSKKIVIVGGVAGGASTAARLRRLDESAQIVMFERDEHISFANCGLPYYLGGVIEDRESLFVQTPERMRNEFNIDARTFSEVTGIDPAGKSVTVNSREKGAYQEQYDILVLAPGVRPVRPPIPGIENKNILSLRSVADADRIKSRLDESGTNRIVVIGGGFTGVETAENCKLRGLDVTLVEALPHILAPFDDIMAARLEQEMEEQGVTLALGDRVREFQGGEDGTVFVKLHSGRSLPADLVVLAIGVSPDTDFLKGSGLALGPAGHLIVDERMLTSNPFIYAVGDAVEVVDFVNGQKTAIPLAGPANRQGRIAADNIAGGDSRYRGSLGSAVIKVFNMTGAVTGSNERLLKKLGKSCRVAQIHAQSHAAFYPGATLSSFRMLYDDNGLVLGAQGVGFEGVDKRIDVIATAIRLKATIHDLAELDLCYAPPFSSAKDPVNVLGFVAENERSSILRTISYEDYLDLDPQSVQVVDVRPAMDFAQDHLEEAVNVPLEELRSRLPELDPKKPVIVCCKIGLRAYVASRVLAQNGYDVRSIAGGMTSVGVARRSGK